MSRHCFGYHLSKEMYQSQSQFRRIVVVVILPLIIYIYLQCLDRSLDYKTSYYMICSFHPSQYPHLCQEVWSLESIFNIWRKDAIKRPAIVSLHPAKHIVAINGLWAVVAALVSRGGTAGDLGGEGREDWADQVKKYKNDPHAVSVWCGLDTSLATLYYW